MSSETCPNCIQSRIEVSRLARIVGDEYGALQRDVAESAISLQRAQAAILLKTHVTAVDRSALAEHTRRHRLTCERLVAYERQAATGEFDYEPASLDPEDIWVSVECVDLCRSDAVINLRMNLPNIDDLPSLRCPFCGGEAKVEGWWHATVDGFGGEVYVPRIRRET